jgi:hypothetical protein
MTGVAWAATTLVAAVALLALGLVVVLARRVRDLTAQVAKLDQPMLPDLPPLGPLPDFAVSTTSGHALTAADLSGPDQLLLFLYGSCDSCHDNLPKTVEALQGAPARPVAVVIGRPDTRAALTAGLEPVAHVIEEYDMSGLANLFHVTGFPSYVRVRDGVMVQAAHGLEELRRDVDAGLEVAA